MDRHTYRRCSAAASRNRCTRLPRERQSGIKNRCEERGVPERETLDLMVNAAPPARRKTRTDG